jgi:hypothetical protein
MRLLSFRILPLLFAAGLGVVAPLAFSVDGLNVRIGKREVLVPAPEDSAPACAESADFRRLMASSLAPGNQLLACWVGAKAWADVNAGRGQSTYPITALTYAKAVGDGASLADFESAKQSTLKQLPSLLKQGESAEQMGQLNQRRANDGIPLSMQAGRVRNEGVFDVRGDSYSYVVFRETQQALVGGAPVKVKEAMAVTLLFHRGIVFMLAVVEQGASPQASLDVRNRSLAWLAKFRAANPG